MIRHALRFLNDESGTAVIEYGVLLTIIAVLAIGGLFAVGGSVSGFFTLASTSLSR